MSAQGHRSVGPSFIRGRPCIVVLFHVKSTSTVLSTLFYNQLIFSRVKGDVCTDQQPKDEVTMADVSAREDGNFGLRCFR